MSLALELKAQAQVLAAAARRDDALAALRAQALAALVEQPFPDTRQEAWKYTPLDALAGGQLTRAAAPLAAAGPWPPLGDCVIVIGNGFLPDRLPALPAGLSARPLNADDAAGIHPDTPFGWLNGASLQQGLRLQTERNARIAGTVHVLFCNRADAPCHAGCRLQLDLAEGSALTLVEHYLGDGPVLANALTRIRAGAGSRLTHYRLQSEAADSRHIGHLQIDQLRDSHVDSSQLMRGCALRRNDVRVRLLEGGATLAMRGVFIARDRSHIDNHITVEHVAPHCQSNQVYKGMAGEQARAVFNGRIHIHPHARGSDASLSNKNLLLSREAEIDSKPELEIYNDDVKCAHGTTVGQLDAGQLFYLRSRGIDGAAAKRMLGTGFVNETLLAMADAAVCDWATGWLGEGL